MAILPDLRAGLGARQKEHDFAKANVFSPQCGQWWITAAVHHRHQRMGSETFMAKAYHKFRPADWGVLLHMAGLHDPAREARISA